MKILAFVAAVLSFIYMDLESQSPVTGYVLPGVLIFCMMYAFWFKGFLALCGAAAAFQYMDLGSHSTIQGVLLPLLFAICLVYIAWWLLLVNFVSVATGAGSDSDSSWISGDSGGGDGGGD